LTLRHGVALAAAPVPPARTIVLPTNIAVSKADMAHILCLGFRWGDSVCWSFKDFPFLFRLEYLFQEQLNHRNFNFRSVYGQTKREGARC